MLIYVLNKCIWIHLNDLVGPLLSHSSHWYQRKTKICFFLFSGCVEIKKFTSLMRIKRKKCESCGITVKSVTQWIQNDTYRNATNFHLWCNKSASAKWSSHSKLLTEQLWSLKMMFLLKLFSFLPRCDWKFIFMIIGSKYCVYATIDRFFLYWTI